jgi:polysaccharide biosynthesis/export protein
MKTAVVLGWLAAAVLAGCSALPTAGPIAKQVVRQAVKDDKPRFDIVNVDQRIVATLAAEPGDSFHARFKKYGKPPEPRIGIGDTLSVTIWEAAGGGLFGESLTGHLSSGARSTRIPDQVVGRDGAITVPYAGRIPAAGRLPEEVQQTVEQRLAGKAIEPQVLVTVKDSISNSVTVSGEVVKGARIPLSPRGDRLLDVIAEAGGARAAVYETFVRLSRGGVTATIPLSTLVTNPDENIYAQPGDVLTLVLVPRSFSVFGATGQNARVTFGAERLTLAEALAKAGGLEDQRSDPAGVFLFRYEPPALVKALGEPALPVGPGGTTPVVYRLDLGDADAYFLAERFPIEDKDILYVANAELNELQKFFTLLNTLTGPVVTGIVVRQAVP